ncbi:DUF1266 domain-containing protein [Croceibacterium mercuriale]|uniref:DUF1266 domain-containing protein n=1 Tax=Croceibacterium mercuriale TaxID=1572751 RepID=UPI00137937FB|nr:DUF1266 domain-containing protein [Croceibacterium mercuriale]
MFKFLREMAQAIKEGAAEGSEEADREIAIDKEATAAEQRQRVAVFERRLAATPTAERLLTAIAAPYREVFMSELGTARDEERPPVYLFCAGLPDKEVDSWKALLNRDFDIEDGDDAAAFVNAFMDTIGEGEATRPEAAVWLVRAAHVATGAVGAGHVEPGRVMDWAAALIPIAADHFTSWSDMGAAFLEGEKSAPGSNMLGRTFLARAVKRLNEDARSPWVKLDWPATGAVPR